MNREIHLALLNKKIAAWRAQLRRLEYEGHKSQAAYVRGWIRSAQRLASRLQHGPYGPANAARPETGHPSGGAAG